MTEKERNKIKKMKKTDDISITSSDITVVGTILRNEIVKSLNKKGYEVEKHDFLIKSGLSFPDNFGYLVFVLEHPQPQMDSNNEKTHIVSVNVQFTKHIKYWVENDLSLRQTMKQAPKKLQKSISSLNLKKFEKFIKQYCIENDKYHEPEEPDHEL